MKDNSIYKEIIVKIRNFRILQKELFKELKSNLEKRKIEEIKKELYDRTK